MQQPEQLHGMQTCFVVKRFGAAETEAETDVKPTWRGPPYLSKSQF